MATLVVFHREALGGWTVVVLAALAIWALINPRAFPPPASTRSWASRAVLGERLWLADPRTGLALRGLIRGGMVLATIGLVPLAWGLFAIAAGPTLLGLGLTLAGKFVFLHAMVRLYDAAAAADPAIGSWLR